MDRALSPVGPVRKWVPPNQKPRPEGRQPVRAPRVIPAAPVAPAQHVSFFHKVGLYSLGAYLFAGYANDMSLHFFGGRAYLTWLSGILVLVSFLACGTPLRAAKSPVGKAWLGFVACLILSTPFSIWRGESLALLTGYFPKVLGLFFYCCAFSLTLKHCRTLIYTNVLCTSALLLCCALFGAADDSGRFSIPSSLFFGNPNDTALALVSGLGFSMFLLLQKSKFAQLLGAVEFILALFYVLKTASRGGFVALCAFFVVWFVFSISRWKLVALVVPAAMVVVMFSSSSINLSRLVEIGTSSSNGETDGAIESQKERTMLFQKSVKFAITHPLLGTGPGTFVDALWADDVANMTHTHAIGTHNTYTQVASECGFPALIFYMCALVGSIRSNYLIMKRTRSLPGGAVVFSMAVALFASLIAFAVETTFHHDAYGPTLPVFTGMSAALYLASRGGNPQWIASEIAAGNV